MLCILFTLLDSQMQSVNAPLPIVCTESGLHLNFTCAIRDVQDNVLHMMQTERCLFPQEAFYSPYAKENRHGG